MFCSKCGTQVGDDAKFCPKCGTTMHSGQVEIAPVRQMPGVACHHTGCQEPVIGQCSGYRGSCGRFFCAKHSVESFCSICVDKAAHDAALRAMLEDYLAAAQRVPHNGCGNWTAFIFLGFLLFGVLQVFDTPLSRGLSMVLPLVAVFAPAMHVNRQESSTVARVATEKPGFAEFYKEYRKQKSSENMATALGAILVAGTAANAVQQYQMRQDIHAIARSLKSA